jgi:hypothetical protein
MNDDDILNELKAKCLPVFGNRVERLNRLKKYYGKYIYLLY